MSFLKSILRRVKRTAQAQVSGQVSSFVGRNVANVTRDATNALQTKTDGAINSLKNKAQNAYVNARLRPVAIKSKRPPGF